MLIRGDVGDPTFCHETVARTLNDLGDINIVVNNAAEQYDWKEITELENDQLERTFRTNVFSHFYLTKAALPHLHEGDTIIATSSVNAFKGNDTLIDYTATKGAIQGLVRSLAMSLMDRGIRVNAVAPGPIWTPLIPASFDEEKVAKWMKNGAQPSDSVVSLFQTQGILPKVTTVAAAPEAAKKAAPKAAAKAAPKAAATATAVADPPEEVAEETPTEEVAEATDEVAAETPAAETPAEDTEETIDEVAAETPAEDAEETTDEVAAETPAEDAAEDASKAAHEDAAEAANEDTEKETSSD